MQRFHPDVQTRINQETAPEILCHTIERGKASTPEEITFLAVRVKLILAKYPEGEFNNECVDGFTALHCAVSKAVPEIVQALLQCPRIDPNAKSAGKTPFHWLCMVLRNDSDTTRGNMRILELFLQDHRVDINLGDKGDDATPFVPLCKNGSTIAILYIIASGKYFNVNYVLSVADEILADADKRRDALDATYRSLTPLQGEYGQSLHREWSEVKLHRDMVAIIRGILQNYRSDKDKYTETIRLGLAKNQDFSESLKNLSIQDATGR